VSTTRRGGSCTSGVSPTAATARDSPHLTTRRCADAPPRTNPDAVSLQLPAALGSGALLRGAWMPLCRRGPPASSHRRDRSLFTVFLLHGVPVVANCLCLMARTRPGGNGGGGGEVTDGGRDRNLVATENRTDFILLYSNLARMDQCAAACGCKKGTWAAFF